MAMRPCDRCLENRWKFRLDETCDPKIVIATCLNCENEVSFAAKRKRPDWALQPHQLKARRQAQERSKPKTITGDGFHDDPNFVDDGVPPW